MAYVYATCVVRVTIFSTGGKFRPVSNFTELHTLTQAARSYSLLIYPIIVKCNTTMVILWYRHCDRITNPHSERIAPWTTQYMDNTVHGYDIKIIL